MVGVVGFGGIGFGEAIEGIGLGGHRSVAVGLLAGSILFLSRVRLGPGVYAENLQNIAFLNAAALH